MEDYVKIEDFVVHEEGNFKQVVVENYKVVRNVLDVFEDCKNVFAKVEILVD